MLFWRVGLFWLAKDQLIQAPASKQDCIIRTGQMGGDFGSMSFSHVLSEESTMIEGRGQLRIQYGSSDWSWASFFGQPKKEGP